MIQLRRSVTFLKRLSVLDMASFHPLDALQLQLTLFVLSLVIIHHEAGDDGNYHSSDDLVGHDLGSF